VKEQARERGHAPVLIVDDDEDIRDIVATLLRDAGFEVAEARHGEEALERLGDAELPCLILLDLMMPVMDGYRFRARQLESPRLAAIPTIIFTAGATGPGVDALGAQAVLRKPIDAAALVRTVAQHC
jgi:CheY-like chemotaxis protein